MTAPPRRPSARPERSGLERTCKPGSVTAAKPRRPVTISLGPRLPGASSSRPGSGCETGRLAPRPPPKERRRTSSCLALLPMGFAEPDRSPGLLVSSYLTVSPLPAETRSAGGLLSVALSLTLRPVGVTHHRAPWSPDFPPARAKPLRPKPRGLPWPAVTRSTPVASNKSVLQPTHRHLDRQKPLPYLRTAVSMGRVFCVFSSGRPDGADDRCSVNSFRWGAATPVPC